MTTLIQTDQKPVVAGCHLTVQTFGQGTPLILLPRENLDPTRLPFMKHLAERFHLHVPVYPGFHGSEPDCWTWMSDVRDLAVSMRQWVEQEHLEGVVLAGFGFGGWVAAEMLTMGSRNIAKLVLVSPMGILPESGEISDQFLVNSEAYARTAFSDQRMFDAIYGTEPAFDQLEAWETNREMTSRLAWKPYMYNRSLPRLLSSCPTPSLIVWGTEDRVVPVSCGTQFASALPNAELKVIQRCGHAVEAERPDTLVEWITAFAG